ncbi:unnamed protein product [Prorocentrum cordatum]|uniref:RRM domain-containing protein n=1 Tax=Prorocentrum cordatum TaxID=2364126 RepID=A0ABN9QT83_9DINO|nr:unnamed protein product [Polarella glacialis]
MAEPEASNVLVISSLPSGIDEKMVKQVLGPYGGIRFLTMQPHQRAARITFSDAGEAKWIRENLDGNIPEGLTEPVAVRYAPTAAAPRPAVTGGGGCGGGDGGGWGGGGKGGGGKGGGGYSPYGGGDWGGKCGGKGDLGGKGGGPGITVIKQGLRWSLPGSGWQAGDPELYIGGLPPDTTDGDLYEIFATFGAIPPRGVKAMLSPEGQCTGVGFVNFIKLEDAQRACEALNGTMLPNGQWMKVNLKRRVNKGEGKGKESA